MSGGACLPDPGSPRLRRVPSMGWVRKPIALTVGPGGPIVLCDDGSSWRLEGRYEDGTYLRSEWTELPPIPGSYREEQLRKDGAEGLAEAADRPGSLPPA